MNDQKITKTFFGSLFLGLATGFASLAVASILGLFFPQEKLTTIFLFVLIEEALKLGALFVLFYYKLFLPKNFLPIVAAGFGIGTGFSIFEIALIFLKHGEVPPTALLPFAIHLTTSLLLAWSLKAMEVEKAKFPSLVPINFAVIVHLCYNIFVAIGM